MPDSDTSTANYKSEPETPVINAFPGAAQDNLYVFSPVLSIGRLSSKCGIISFGKLSFEIGHFYPILSPSIRIGHSNRIFKLSNSYDTNRGNVNLIQPENGLSGVS